MHTIDDILDMVEHYWLPLDPNQTADWQRSLEGLDLDVAAQMVTVMAEAHDRRPSLGLFISACRAAQARNLKEDWFAEQRAKLRRQAPPEQEESPQEQSLPY